MIAAVLATGEGPVANSFDAPNSNQVAQRNIQFSGCTYPLTNATTSGANVVITLTAGPAGIVPSLGSSPDIEVAFDDPTQSWYNVSRLQPGAGTSFLVTSTAGKTTVRLGANQVTLNSVPLAAGESRAAAGTFFLDGGSTATLSLQAALTDGNGVTKVTNGVTCQSTGQAPPK